MGAVGRQVIGEHLRSYPGTTSIPQQRGDRLPACSGGLGSPPYNVGTGDLGRFRLHERGGSAETNLGLLVSLKTDLMGELGHPVKALCGNVPAWFDH